MEFRAVLIASLLISGTAEAGFIEYAGTVSNLSGSSASHPNYDMVEVGDLITGTFSYDPSDSADSNPWDAVGRYGFDATNSSFSMSIYDVSDNNRLLYEYTGHLRYITTENNWQYAPNPSLFPTIDAYTPVALLENGSEVFLRFQNRDVDLDLISSDALPDVPLDFVDYNYRSASITLPTGNIGQIDFTPTYLAAAPIEETVPAPSPALLLLFGLIPLAQRFKPSIQSRN